jgi:hypothetical protein
VGGDPGRDHRQRQRQAGAARHDHLRCRRVGRDPGRADPAGEQLVRLRVGQPAEAHQVDGFVHDQTGEPVAAGHHRHTSRRAGQQRTDLGHVPGVVQDDQHPLVGQDAAVQADLGVEAVGDAPGRHLQRFEQPANSLRGTHRGLVRAEAPKVHVELTIVEVLDHPVGPVDGQRRLADPGQTLDHGDRRSVAALRRQQRVEPSQILHPAGEHREVTGQLTRHRGRARLVGRRGRYRLVTQDAIAQVAQFRPGIETEFVGQPLPDLIEHEQRVAPPVRQVQGGHQLAGELFMPGVLRAQLGQLADHRRGPAELDLHLRPSEPDGRPALVQPLGGGRDGRRLETVQRRAPPQRQGIAEQFHRRLVGSAGGVPLGLPHLLLEDVYVELTPIGRQPQAVPAALGLDEVTRTRLTQQAT